MAVFVTRDISGMSEVLELMLSERWSKIPPHACLFRLY